jgi:uncharacterized protein YutE (UPF0331/DUF86 family)
MQDHVLPRIAELVAKGTGILRSSAPEEYWMQDVVASQAWFSSAANVVQQVTPANSFYVAELKRIADNEQLRAGFPRASLEKTLGLLRSIEDEAKAGLLTKLEDQVIATAFDDFLDHAGHYHRGGKVKEAAVLASAVLEDTIKRIARKNGLSPSGSSLDPLIDELAKISVFTSVLAKRLKSYAGVRNHALHAEWDELDIKDVGAQISGIRELLDGYL